MKKTFLLLTLVAGTLISCEKSEINESSSVESQSIPNQESTIIKVDDDDKQKIAITV